MILDVRLLGLLWAVAVFPFTLGKSIQCTGPVTSGPFQISPHDIGPKIISYNQEENRFYVGGGDNPTIVDLYQCDSETFGLYSNDEVVYGHLTVGGPDQCLQATPVAPGTPFTLGPCNMEDDKNQFGQYWSWSRDRKLLELSKPDGTPVQGAETHNMVTIYGKESGIAIFYLNLKPFAYVF